MRKNADVIIMDNLEKRVAAALLDVKAVELNTEEPFTWASGLKSPIYCDNRKLLSYPAVRTFIADRLEEIIREQFKKVDVIAAVATGAIAIGAIVAEKMGLPLIYIRPQPKDHGTGSQIEGVFEKGANIVIIEDLISTGMSSLAAAKAVSQQGGMVEGMVAIFSYNFTKARKAFETANITLYTLTDYDTLIQVAGESSYISESEMSVLRDWRFKPENWGK
jgi:orotate phosphoribosyltransferase